MYRHRIITVLTATAALAAAGTAHAAHASYHVSDAGSLYSFDEGADPLTNKITVSSTKAGVVRFDDAGVPPGSDSPQCVVAGSTTVTCTGDGGQTARVVVDVGPGNDRVSVAQSVLQHMKLGGKADNLLLGGGEGDDFLEAYYPAAILYGNEGSDTLSAGLGTKILDGGPGVDYADYSNLVGDLTFDMSSPDAVQGGFKHDRWVGIEGVIGGKGPDTLTGSTGDDRIDLKAGTDKIASGGGADVIEARDKEKDTIACGAGNDTVYADAVDVVAADCEHVTRAQPPLNGGVVNPPQPPQPNPDPAPQPPSGGESGSGGGSGSGSGGGGTGGGSGAGSGAGSGTGSGTAADRTAPVIRNVSFAPATLRRHRATKLRFRLSESASVTGAFARVLDGRRSGGRCVAVTRRLVARHAKRCTRVVAVKGFALTRKARAGRTDVRFTGRIGRRTLSAGRYRVTLTALDAAGNRSRRVTAALRVTR